VGGWGAGEWLIRKRGGFLTKMSKGWDNWQRQNKQGGEILVGVGTREGVFQTVRTKRVSGIVGMGKKRNLCNERRGSERKSRSVVAEPTGLDNLLWGLTRHKGNQGEVWGGDVMLIGEMGRVKQTNENESIVKGQTYGWGKMEAGTKEMDDGPVPKSNGTARINQQFKKTKGGVGRYLEGQTAWEGW